MKISVMCPFPCPPLLWLALACLGLPCVSFTVTMHNDIVLSEKAMREQGHVSSTHTHTHSHTLYLTYTHALLLFTLGLRFLVGSCSRLFPYSFALCPLFPILLFCTCHENIYRHFSVSLFLGEFSCSALLLLFFSSPHLISSSFSLSTIHTPVHSSLFLAYFAKCCQMFAVFPVVC